MVVAAEIYEAMPLAIKLTKNKMDAEDIIHDAYLKLIDANYEERGFKSRFINKAVFNAFIDKYRSRKREQFGKNKMNLIIENCYTPDYESDELKEGAKMFIARFVHNLNDRDAKIWKLYLEGFSQKEISELTDLNTNAIAGVVHRIRTKIINKIGI